MSSHSSYEESYSNRFQLPQGVGDTEDVERYQPGGFHPVHLGDKFDDGRYRVVNKLGAGGYSTVWLARDDDDKKWVALKIVDAEHSMPTAEKSALIQATMPVDGTKHVAVHRRQFTFDGPNGHHLCLVLPVFGPSMSELSYHFNCRLTPWMARRAACQATRAVADLHSQGLCHGDVTTGNLLLGMVDIDRYEEHEIDDLFGRPVTGMLVTDAGEVPGPEAPRYIVRNVNFLSCASIILKPDIKLVDFDQGFPISSPPSKRIGTPLEFLAPEVAAGLEPSPASDVWALGCCILRFRSGIGPFSSPFDVTCPADLVSYVLYTLGGVIPREWQDTLWDSDGFPTKDASKGEPLVEWTDDRERSLRDIVRNVWDEPNGRVVDTGCHLAERKLWVMEDHQPFPSNWSKMAWNPKAIKVDDAYYLAGYDKDWDKVLPSLPKTPEHEAALLYDLLAKIFVYDPKKRPTANELLEHPWFHLDEPQQ